MRRDRVVEQPAFLLHAIPYRETSLVLDLFTLDHGRISAVAKGAKRPKSALRAVLLQFQPLEVAYSGRSELRTLTGAEWLGGLPSPKGQALLSAFYLNELLIKLLAREDPHPILFAAYREALAAMSTDASLEETLRRFEWQLLRDTGYAPDLTRDSSQALIDVNQIYQWSPHSGFLRDEGSEESVSGATLRDIDAQTYGSELTRFQAKHLTRRILNHCLAGTPLKTRRILLDLQKALASQKSE